MYKCAVCGEKMRHALGEEYLERYPDSVQPSGGLHFKTYGHYGSTYFDPIDGSCIDITICDSCVENIVKNKNNYGEFRNIE